MIRSLTITAFSLGLAACAGTPDPVAGKPVAATEVSAGIPAEGLPAQKLAAGECGLFLWGMAPPRKFVFFIRANTGDALVLVNDAAHSLRMVSAGGDVFGQFLTEMSFAGPSAGGRVTVSLSPGEVLEGGQRVDTGNILFAAADGWETILPVTGVRACMPGG